MRPRFSGCLRACDPLQGCVPVISTRMLKRPRRRPTGVPPASTPGLEACARAFWRHRGAYAVHLQVKLRPLALPPATILPAVLLSKGSCESLGKGARPIGFANALEANNALIGSDQIRMSTDAVQMLSSLNAGLFRPWSSNPAR
jgi:hypothetical protein